MNLITVHGGPVSYFARECGLLWRKVSAIKPDDSILNLEGSLLKGSSLMIMVNSDIFSPITVMKYNNQTTDVVTDVSSIFRELDHAVQEANVLSQNAGGEI